MTDDRDLLFAPLGQPGSGRVRYGAAMALWRDGKISAEALEVYRAASAHDGRDPQLILKELGLASPGAAAPASVLARLYTALRDYLLALDHPGAAEVRAGLPARPVPERPVSARRNDVVDRWLEPALDGLYRSHPDLAASIAQASGQLEWITYDGYPIAEIGETFANGHAFASVVGGDAPFAATGYELGIFLIAPNVLYRDHKHAAPELYAPLTGPHGWRFGTGKPLQVKPAHQPVWNPPGNPHLTRVGSQPFLSIFVWTKDVNEVAEVIMADDWPAIEAQRID